MKPPVCPVKIDLLGRCDQKQGRPCEAPVTAYFRSVMHPAVLGRGENNFYIARCAEHSEVPRSTDMLEEVSYEVFIVGQVMELSPIYCDARLGDIEADRVQSRTCPKPATLFYQVPVGIPTMGRHYTARCAEHGFGDTQRLNKIDEDLYIVGRIIKLTWDEYLVAQIMES